MKTAFVKPSPEQVKSFLGSSTCVIVEPSQAFAANIQSCLTDLGIPAAQITTAKKASDAIKIIQEQKPKIVIAEYDLDDGMIGLAMIEMLNSYLTPQNRVAIIVTKNASNPAIAECAEDVVDTFVLKPFSVVELIKQISEVFNRKISPTDYMKKIQQGYELFLQKKYEDALAEFTDAKKLDPIPLMAFYYSGLCYQKNNQVAQALAEFQQGRAINNTHYKCLIGEFELYVEQKEFKNAYGLIEVIKKNFPITSHRLGQIFIVTVFTQNFDDLAGHYELFNKLEQRNTQLIELSSLALLTAGRHFLKKNDVTKAIGFFEMGFSTTSKDFKYLERVVVELLKVNANQEADAIVMKAQPADVGTPAYNTLRFKIDQAMLPPHQVIDRGKKLIASGEGSPEIYLVVFELLAKAQQERPMEAFFSQATMAYPNLRETLTEIQKKYAKSEQK